MDGFHGSYLTVNVDTFTEHDDFRFFLEGDKVIVRGTLSYTRTFGKELVPSSLSDSPASASTSSTTLSLGSDAGAGVTDAVRSSFPFSAVGFFDDLSLGFLRNRWRPDLDFDLVFTILTSSESVSLALSSKANPSYNSGNGKFRR